MFKKPPFKLVKISDYGTDNPIVNRMSLQFFEILKTGGIDLNKKQIEEIETVLMDCMHDLLYMKERLLKFQEIENAAIGKVLEKGVTFQTNAYSFDPPTKKLKELFEEFSIKGVIILRRIKKIAKTIFNDIPVEEKKYIRFLKNKFLDDKNALDFLDHHMKWYKYFYDMRGEIEHRDVKITEFDVDLDGEGKPLIRRMKFEKNNILVADYMNYIMNSIFAFCESFTVLLLNTKSKKGFKIISVPKDLRKQQNDFMYTMGFHF